MLNLDTHILIFALTDSLRTRERTILSQDSWSISAIVLWEIAKLAQLRRIELSLDDPDLLQTLYQIQVWPVDLPICRMSVRLDFQGDPADEIIAATSVVHNLPLVTRDRAIRASKMVTHA